MPTTNRDKPATFIDRVEQDDGAEGAAAKSGHLRDRMYETKVESEGPGGLEKKASSPPLPLVFSSLGFGVRAWSHGPRRGRVDPDPIRPRFFYATLVTARHPTPRYKHHVVMPVPLPLAKRQTGQLCCCIQERSDSRPWRKGRP